MSNPFHEAMTEEQLHERVTTLARHRRWLIHHDRRQDLGIGGDAGFPDLVLARKGRIIIAELKRETEKPRPNQENWLQHLGIDQHPRDRLLIAVWRPSDWPEIEQELA